MPITLYYTDALPMHYVAKDAAGDLWLIPASPMGPEVWQHAKPYRGNHELTPARPPALNRVYDPDQAEPPKRGRGRPASTRPPTERTTLELRADVAQAIRDEAAETGEPQYLVIELAIMAAYPERFDHD